MRLSDFILNPKEKSWKIGLENEAVYNNALKNDYEGFDELLPNFIEASLFATKSKKNKISLENLDVGYLLPVKINSRLIPVKVVLPAKNNSSLKVQIPVEISNDIALSITKKTSVIAQDELDNWPISLVNTDVKKKSAKKVVSKKNSMLTKVGAFGLALTLIGAGIGSRTVDLSNLHAFGKVAGVSESAISQEDKDYKAWIESKNNGIFINKEADSDSDGLTNYEEFRLDTNPLNPNTCDKDLTDSQLLVQLINPKTCKPINVQSDEEFNKFSSVLNIPQIQKNISEESSKIEVSKTESDLSVLSLFSVKNYAEISNISTESVQETAKLSATKIEYLQTIQKIQNYMNQYRSYEEFDRDYPLPVSPAKFLDVSIKYNVPLKYVLAIARNESRFGTDIFTKSGTPTRPGLYKNIYSIGLTENTSAGYNSWDDGVEGFGKWYKNFNDRGVSDCRKWRIYNPNGDYCEKIEGLANEIQAYLDK